jgi:hypothetical protein
MQSEVIVKGGCSYTHGEPIMRRSEDDHSSEIHKPSVSLWVVKKAEALLP